MSTIIARVVTATVLGLACFTASAGTLAANAEAEITHLFDYLKQSSCEFNRNGTWYDAASAAAHLKQKYDYLRDKDKIHSGEDFIALAASKSSMSGQAYQVRCASQTAVSSESWFRAELLQYRQVSAVNTAMPKQ